MKAGQFDYVRAESIASCAAVLEEADGDGKVLAGGQSLTPVLAMRLARPRIVVDINKIPGLGTIEPRDGSLRIGALVRHVELLDQEHSPLLAEAARWIGHPAIRSRGTFGGSLAHADPSAEWPVVATALEATLTVAGAQGQRTLPAGDFFLGPLEPDLRTDELLTSVEIPIPQAWGFAELSRRHGDFGMVIVACAQVAGRWRIAIGGVGPVPLRAVEAESILDHSTNAGGVRTAAAAAAAATSPGDDLHGSREYRVAMVEEFAFRAISDALSRASTGSTQ